MKRRNLLGKLYVLAMLGTVFLAAAIHEGRFLGYPLHPVAAPVNHQKQFSVDEAARLLPGTVELEFRSDDEAIAFAGDGRQIGTLLHTQPLARHITGYGSWLPILIGLNHEDRVTGLLLQKNDETPGFVNRLEKAGFFASWNGQNASTAVTLPVDAVSRATMTSRATIDSIRLRLAKFLEIEQARRKIDYYAVVVEILAWAFLLVAFSGCFFSSRLARYRKLILVAAVLLPGFVLGRFFSIELVYAWAIHGVPLRNQLYLAVVVFLTVMIPFLSGRSWYCNWYCPYGAAQELLGNSCRKKFDLTGRTARLLRYCRPMLFAVVALCLITGTHVSLNSIEPFSAFLLSSASTTVLFLALGFLFLSPFIRRPWCNYFCPSGQLVEMLRVGSGDQTQRLEGREAREVKIHAVINVLLAVVIIILLMSPAKIGNNVSEPEEAHKSGEVRVVEKITGNASETATSALSMSENQTLKTIYTRKSVRSFTGAEVPRDQLTELVKAGMAAPTARNRQPWQFIVVNDRPAMDAMAERLPYAKMLASAGAAIVVCGDMEIATAGGSEGMWMLDCSAATQNILLAAESMKLGAVWTAAYPYDDRMAAVSEVLHLPPHLTPLCVIPVGYPDGSDKPKDKWKPERLHWNTFSPATPAVEIK
ncbi:MAG: nitroreductase family protein [Candidatus Riflebacteria bacterium]|nr:nitroreductase family protein [Candidatus Riflebacteria bacterium]